MLSTHLKDKNQHSLLNVMMFSLFWALQIFVFKLGLISGAQVLTFQIVAILTALAILTILLAASSFQDLRLLFLKQPAVFWQLFLANAIQSGLGTSLSIIGIALTETINAGFLVKLTSVTTTLFAWMMLRERMTWRKGICLLVMMGGAYLLMTKGLVLIPKMGDLLILAACVCWSLGTVLVRKVLRYQAVNPDMVTLQKPIAGLPVFLVLLGLTRIAPELFGDLIDLLSCCTMTYIHFIHMLAGGLCLAVTWFFLNRTLKVSTASYMTMMSMSTPIIVTLLALVFLDEQMVAVQILGAGMIIVAGIATYFSDIAYT